MRQTIKPEESGECHYVQHLTPVTPQTHSQANKKNQAIEYVQMICRVTRSKDPISPNFSHCSFTRIFFSFSLCV